MRSLLLTVLCLLGLVAPVAGGSSPGPRAQPARRAQPAPRARPASVRRPPIIPWWIPFGPVRKAETAAYARRHYGFSDYHLIKPRVIVEHFSDASTAQADWNTFAADIPDVELGELPQVCAHYVVDGSGRIYQMVPTAFICRHTVGLNYTAIGIEHTGYSDSDVLNDPSQLRASLRLTHYLACHFGISAGNVIGHNESLSSPYHHERVAALRSQTHNDFQHADMVIYRRALARLGRC